jgi:hypothetical protein
MDLSQKKSSAPERPETTDSAERRRVARIVHDDRGNASVKWHDAPSDYKRQVLEVLEPEPKDKLSLVKTPRSFDPYSRSTVPEPKKAAGPRKDLRKLSEWIKMMRELEERKARGEAG